MTAIQASGTPLPQGQEKGDSRKSWFQAFFEQIGRLATLYASRRALLLMSRADERLLKDIGVSRGDVDWALSQPWHIDGSMVLAERLERLRTARWSGRRLTGH